MSYQSRVAAIRYCPFASSNNMPSALTDGVWADGWPNSGTQAAAGDTLPEPCSVYYGGGMNGRINGNAGQAMSRYSVARHGFMNPSPSAPTFASVTPTTFLPKGVNVACCEGHVEYSKLNNLCSYCLHAESVPKPAP